MNSSPGSESNGNWFLHIETNEFTNNDKTEAFTTLQAMARGLVGSNDMLAQEYAYFATKLQSMPPTKAMDCLITYLDPESCGKVVNVKSFIYLKKITEEFLEDNRLLEKRLAEKVVLSLLHILFYKTLPCIWGNHCKHSPRKIVHKNDFLDVEMDCYFYHHEKDRRRFVLTDNDKEFRYAGNFADNKKGNVDKSGFSFNFFESLFHPLYYKNFKCVRTKCEKSVFCPYFHSEEEKTIWSVFFREFFGKDRDVFTKKKNGEEENTSRMRFKKYVASGPGVGARMFLANSGLIK